MGSCSFSKNGSAGTDRKRYIYYFGGKEILVFIFLVSKHLLVPPDGCCIIFLRPECLMSKLPMNADSITIS